MLCPRCFSALRHDDSGSCLHGFGRLIHPLDLADQCSTDGCNARGIGRASPNDSITAHRRCSGGRSSTQSSAAASSPSVNGGEVEADAPSVHRLQGVWIFALRPGPVAIVSIHQTLRLACAQVAAKPSPEVTALSASVIGVERPRWRVNRVGEKRCRGRSRQFGALSAWMCMRGCPQEPTSTMCRSDHVCRQAWGLNRLERVYDPREIANTFLGAGVVFAAGDHERHHRTPWLFMGAADAEAGAVQNRRRCLRGLHSAHCRCGVRR